MSDQTSTRYAFRDIGVRIAIAYFSVFWIFALFDTGDTPRRVWKNTWGVVSSWIELNLLSVARGVGSADARHSVSEHALAIAVAIVVGLVWTRFSDTTNASKREGALRLMLRYYMGIVVMVYAGAKVVPMQFPPLDLEEMARPVGALAPMGLLWSFMGYSPAYTAFAGLAEWIGAFLLFFRRTTTLGACILLGVLSNVALMNYAYDVPVKLLSVNLSLMAATLVALDAPRLLDVFLHNRSTSPTDLSASDVPRWLMKARPLLKPLLVVLASAGPIAGSAFIYRNVRGAKSPLVGVYAVTHTPTHALGELASWTHVTFAKPTSMTASFGSDSVVRYRAETDTAARTIRYWNVNASMNTQGNAHTLHYNRDSAGGLVITSGVDTIVLKAMDPRQRYRMLR